MVSRNTLIRQYNTGELEKEQVDDFELHMMNDPDLARDVELDALLASGTQSANFAQHAPTHRRWRRYAITGIAACAAGVVIGLAFRSHPQAWGEVAFAELGELRGSVSNPATTLSTTSDALLILELPALTTTSNQSVWISGVHTNLDVLAKQKSGVVSIALAPGTLSPGNYQAWVHNGDHRGPTYDLIVR